jgi:hypothetical protein
MMKEFFSMERGRPARNTKRARRPRSNAFHARAFLVQMLTRTTFVIARRKVAVAIQYVFLDCFAFGSQ